MAGFRLVVDDNSIDISELSLYSIGGMDEDARIVFENDACVIMEDKAGSVDLTIWAKEKDELFEYGFIQEVCKDIRALRKQLDTLFSVRDDTLSMYSQYAKYWDNKHNNE